MEDRSPDAESRPTQMRGEITGLTAEINSERGDILVRGFWQETWTT